MTAVGHARTARRDGPCAGTARRAAAPCPGEAATRAIINDTARRVHRL